MDIPVPAVFPRGAATKPLLALGFFSGSYRSFTFSYGVAHEKLLRSIVHNAPQWSVPDEGRAAQLGSCATLAPQQQSGSRAPPHPLCPYPGVTEVHLRNPRRSGRSGRPSHLKQRRNLEILIVCRCFAMGETSQKIRYMYKHETIGLRLKLSTHNTRTSCRERVFRINGHVADVGLGRPIIAVEKNCVPFCVFINLFCRVHRFLSFASKS